MMKLLEAYRADSTDENAEKLAKYNAKHPMAEAFLGPDEYLDLKKALEQHKSRKKFLTARPEPLF